MTAERVCPETNDTYTGKQCPHCGGVHSTPTHTPGPWTAHSGMVWKDGPTVYPKGDDDGIPIARMDREPGNGTLPVERDANAQLIAAAPEMLEALYSALNIEGIGPEQAEKIGLDYAWHFAKVRAAIAKAEGR